MNQLCLSAQRALSRKAHRISHSLDHLIGHQCKLGLDPVVLKPFTLGYPLRRRMHGRRNKAREETDEELAELHGVSDRTGKMGVRCLVRPELHMVAKYSGSERT